mmetsp:Transcript_86883/g.187985  ORF Transcript_86883/g.187985 Transcript_86883/m.187985 type:complete len:114 (+) Transcript_86883:2-343(+)
MFCVASGRKPLALCTGKAVLRSLRRGEALDLEWEPGSRLLTTLRPIMERCMVIQPEDRPTAQEVHRWTHAQKVRDSDSEHRQPSADQPAGASPGSSAREDDDYSSPTCSPISL